MLYIFKNSFGDAPSEVSLREIEDLNKEYLLDVETKKLYKIKSIIICSINLCYYINMSIKGKNFKQFSDLLIRKRIYIRAN